MGFTVLRFSLLIFICFIVLTSSAYPLHSTFSSEIMQKRKLEDKVIDGSKIEGGGGHGGNSHGNGNSGSPDTRGGGAAVIPVYAAGAANKNNQHQTRHESAKTVHCIFCNNCYRFFEGIVFGDLAMYFV
ncbi:hypothetical protein DEO72_LG9g3701 [Vigna unguiculata]|uniref:Uncharacterized protein n=1 Tax=Vigna unguiculata TaxID=3917 RepID=A0A4D6N6X6_VIGUN|nr:hypothetical protein DEO72_LG9g3701 [Vigna unguiculata]